MVAQPIAAIAAQIYVETRLSVSSLQSSSSSSKIPGQFFFCLAEHYFCLISLISASYIRHYSIGLIMPRHITPPSVISLTALV